MYVMLHHLDVSQGFPYVMYTW